MQDDVVADGAVLPDRDGKAGIGVERAVILDLGALAEFDPFSIAAQDRAEPDAGIELEPNAAEHARALGDPIASFARQFRRLSIELENRHGVPQEDWNCDWYLLSSRPSGRCAAPEARAGTHNHR